MLRSERIAELLRQGEQSNSEDPLVISPKPELAQLDVEGASSIDLRLGTWFAALRQARTTHLAPDQAHSGNQLTKVHYVPFGSQYYLHPGNFVLGVTLQWLRLPKNLAGQAIGRSSWGRRGLIIATAIGVHPGFRGCLTLELSNVGQIPIALPPGARICQLCLFETVGSNVDSIDHSQFIGRRRPGLGALKSDSIELQLAKAPSWQSKR
jgi:dCTP deaminase